VTLFRHFGSKKNLLMACVENFNAGGFSATFEAELGGDYPSDIARMARLQLENTAENLDVLRLMLSDTRNLPELQEAMRSGSSGNQALLAAYFQRQIEAGVVRRTAAEALAWAFDSLFPPRSSLPACSMIARHRYCPMKECSGRWLTCSCAARRPHSLKSKLLSWSNRNDPPSLDFPGCGRHNPRPDPPDGLCGLLAAGKSS
jgi:hypothetical protein